MNQLYYPPSRISEANRQIKTRVNEYRYFMNLLSRYDCRGALNDLTPYLPKSEGFERSVGLSIEEKRIESYCEQERYRALVVNEDEELLYQGELFCYGLQYLFNDLIYDF